MMKPEEQQAAAGALETPANQEEKKTRRYYTYRRPLIVPNYMDIINKITFIRFEYYTFNDIVGGRHFQNTYHNITEEIGDVFDADPSWALAHCVSQDLVMSKGIAVDFQRRFNNLKFLRGQKARVGQVAVLYHTNNDGISRFIFYMVTKHQFYQKPTYFNIYCSLYYLRQICEELGIDNLAVPQIACGLDRMDFRRIKQLIHLAFLGTSIQIHIFKLPIKSPKETQRAPK